MASLAGTLFVLLSLSGLSIADREICLGSTETLGLNLLQNKYSGCQIIEGSLSLTVFSANLTSSSFDFLANLTEITGFLRIIGSGTNITLPNLKVIRGRESHRVLIKGSLRGNLSDVGPDIPFSIVIGNSPGVTKWPFPALQQVVQGKMLLINLPKLSDPNTIDWSDILPNGKADIYSDNVGTNSSKPNCSGCAGNYCWSDDQCHIRTSNVCNKNCPSGSRCRGPEILDCCAPDCLGGCDKGLDDTQCFACRDFINGDKCVDQCPALVRFDPVTVTFIPQPDGRYILGDACVVQCPNGTVADGQNCVNVCPRGKTPDDNRICVECKGPCKVVCVSPDDGVVTTANYLKFENCTDLIGNLKFRGGLLGVGNLSQADLEVFRSLRSISGYLEATSSLPTQIRSLEFLRNLEIIKGEQTAFETTSKLSVYIQSTSLRVLGFKSLTSILAGNIQIVLNTKLCLDVDKAGLVDTKIIAAQIATIRLNNNTCGSDYCDSECNQTTGCWGPEPDTCLKCKNFDYYGTCVDDCTAATQAAGGSPVYANSLGVCLPCHEECSGSCTGPGNDECQACKNVKNGTFCQPVCPPDTYNLNNVCYQCDDACENGCTGPSNSFGSGGCNNCSDILLVDANETQILQCFKDSCPQLPQPQYDVRISDGNSTFFGRKICRRCNSLCTSCVGPGPGNCFGQCTTVNDDGRCTEECSPRKYANSQKDCQDCPTRCGSPGCFLENDDVQCNPCTLFLATINETDSCVENCPEPTLTYLSRCYMTCPNESYPVEVDKVCKRCNQECKAVLGNRTCSGPGNVVGEVCLNGCARFKQEGKCVSECRSGLEEVYYYLVNGTERPYRRDNGIEGPSPTQRDQLSEQEQLVDGEQVFRTEAPLETPPPEAELIRMACEPPPTQPPPTPQPLKFEDLIGPIIGAVLGFLVVVAGVSVALYFGFRWSEKRRGDEDELEGGPALDNPMYGGGDNFGMMNMKSGPAAVAPSEAQLVLVQESSLELLEVLGSGAFGTVYKGNWLPEGESEKLSVAVKVLNEGTGAAASKELLQEAVTMSAIDHPHLVRLLCVCMASRVMLITQLVSLGSMLSYLKKRKKTLTGEALLVFSYQVARGMVYLEQKRLVHRDLAARNVLVQTPMMVKISDFGLSKILDVDQGHFQSGGEKMPIKWLAPESLLTLQFTHKTDVWAFGVTMWEILTFGNQPFKGKKGSEMLGLLQSGERLPHPKVCTPDVYAIMLECWDLSPDERPTFKLLSRLLGRMYKTPEKYVTTEADHLRAERGGKLQTGTYEMATAFAEYNTGDDDDGYDNDAGVTFNPYENPRDCVPGALYSNAGLGMSSLEEEDEDENQYDNAPTANGRVPEDSGYDNPVTVNGSVLKKVGEDEEEEAAYDNPIQKESGQESELSPQYDNLDMASDRKSQENDYDNPLEMKDDVKPGDVAKTKTEEEDPMYATPDVGDMDGEEEYQDPTVGLNGDDGMEGEEEYQDPTVGLDGDDGMEGEEGYQDPTADFA
eukprot:m.171588 g.171588  ORF g.171588 m.171588 type:complete len:1503 (+) comp39060_c0_seq1:197-4705(+)